MYHHLQPPGCFPACVGREQAREAGKEVVIEARALRRKVALCASDFLRAWQTAEHVLEALTNAGVDVWLDSIRMEVALRERYFGALEGASAGNYSQV